MCGRFVEINHAKQQINTFSGNLFIPLTNRHNLWIIIICKKCSVKSDHRDILRYPQTRIKNCAHGTNCHHITHGKNRCNGSLGSQHPVHGIVCTLI